jgi:hypothetical protein
MMDDDGGGFFQLCTRSMIDLIFFSIQGDD